MGELPRDWRQANVVPIYKKGPKQLPGNYRPVTSRHLEGRNILTDRQHSFRGKRSCVTQLLELVEDLHRGMQKGWQTDIIVLHFYSNKVSLEEDPSSVAPIFRTFPLYLP
jgi:hypothetical protein